MQRILVIVLALFLPGAGWSADTVDGDRATGLSDAEVIADAEAEAIELVDELESQAETLQFLNAVDVDVREFIWEWRLLVVMADSPNNPDFERQLTAIAERADEFLKRDVVVIFDAEPAANSPLRQVLRPRGFVTAIIDKDGEVKARRPSPRTGRELMAVIDKFPSRRQEILERMPSGR